MEQIKRERTKIEKTMKRSIILKMM